jgi:hypothetical protein
MTMNGNLQPANDTSKPNPYKHGILVTALLASLIDYVVAGIVIMLTNGTTEGFADGFFFGCINFFSTLPFTLLATVICRKNKMSERSSFIATLLIGFLGIPCVGLIIVLFGH